MIENFQTVNSFIQKYKEEVVDVPQGLITERIYTELVENFLFKSSKINIHDTYKKMLKIIQLNYKKTKPHWILELKCVVSQSTLNQ